jgi:RNA polymerase sigma-70 factor (ECF subfamily)
VPASDPSKAEKGQKPAHDAPPDAGELGDGPASGPDSTPHDAEDDAAASVDDPVIASLEPDAATRLPDFTGGNVNRRDLEASNKEVRRREADEDRELILLAQKGDQAAFRKLVERHQRRAFAIAVGLVRDENDARELVQEAFLRVYRSLGSFQGGSSFFTWLYRIVTNLSIDLLRKPSRRDVELDEAREIDEADIPLLSRIDGADPLDVIRRGEIRNKLEAALDALPVYHRGVIVMREVEGLSYEEMAEAMGVSKGTIMSRLFHARQKLQRALADCYAEEVSNPTATAGDKP